MEYFFPLNNIHRSILDLENCENQTLIKAYDKYYSLIWHFSIFEKPNILKYHYVTKALI